MDNNKKAIFYALFAAFLYSLSTPFSKILLSSVSSSMMASFLYLGAGISMSFFFICDKEKKNLLVKEDILYVILMVVLDIAAPILMMYGLKEINASSASLLNNFEIIATSLFAFIIFKEKISNKLIIGILFVFVSCIILSNISFSDISFNKGSIYVVLATCLWGFENNCTRKISSKNTSEIVMIKGLFSGLGSLIFAFVIGDNLPNAIEIIEIILLGVLAYGMSIFFYIKSQSLIGAAKTSVFYSFAPFIGSFLSLVLINEEIGLNYLIGLVLMIIGILFVTKDIKEG